MTFSCEALRVLYSLISRSTSRNFDAVGVFFSVIALGVVFAAALFTVAFDLVAALAKVTFLRRRTSDRTAAIVVKTTLYETAAETAKTLSKLLFSTYGRL